AAVSAFMAWSITSVPTRAGLKRTVLKTALFWLVVIVAIAISSIGDAVTKPAPSVAAKVVAIQPNVPMSGLGYQKWRELRARHVEMAEGALAGIRAEEGYDPAMPVTVVFPESPMNFRYDEDEEFQAYIHAFARRNNVTVLFNSAEP